MAKPYDSRLIAVVGQAQFEVELNRFCKLVPILYADGARPSPGDFPNDGELWWMLAAQTVALAEPGRLVSCHVEDAREFNEHDPTKSRYQAQRESVRDLNPREDALEILNLPADAFDSVQDLVSGGYRLTTDCPLPSTVLLRWRSDVYGPFAATPEPAAPGGRMRASFAPANNDMTVYQIPADLFRDAAQPACTTISTKVSPSDHRRSECSNLLTIKHELIFASGFERVLGANPKKLLLEPIDRKLVRFAKQCLSRRKRQEFRTLLEELELTGRETAEAQELAEAVGRIKKVTDKQDASLDTVTKALLDSGLLGEDRLRKAEQEYAEKYVQERKAELEGKIDLTISARRDEARRVEGKLKELQSKLQMEEEGARAQLMAQLEREREVARREIEAERERLKRDKAEFQRQEALLKQNLEKVTLELRESGDEVVNRFLMIAPLLGSHAYADPARSKQDAEPPATARREPAAEFILPSWITDARGAGDDELTEEAFLERFCRVVEANGFTYRQFDLQRFHISAKCGDLTVLGGPSGTGKSTLPALYAQALLGDSADRQTADGERVGCLMVNINPSWMDARDLLGHTNTLDRRYYPADSGLYPYLVCAHEEYARRASASGLYVACLDEMNLSQVEHYFSDFMMVLERRGEQRAIQCFSPENIADDCPFRNWPRLILPPTLRFVGTVNFDETTRLLSDRLLDRVNLIRLASGALPSAAATDGGPFAKAAGRMITLADFQAWQHDYALSSELGSLLDELRPLLAKMGCPLSPRVYRAICRFVSSAREIMSPQHAFDAQLAQRVVPKIRNLLSTSQLDSLDSMIQTLEGSSIGTFDETRLLLSDVQESARSRGWDIGE